MSYYTVSVGDKCGIFDNWEAVESFSRENHSMILNCYLQYQEAEKSLQPSSAHIRYAKKPLPVTNCITCYLTSSSSGYGFYYPEEDGTFAFEHFAAAEVQTRLIFALQGLTAILEKFPDSNLLIIQEEELGALFQNSDWSNQSDDYQREWIEYNLSLMQGRKVSFRASPSKLHRQMLTSLVQQLASMGE